MPRGARPHSDETKAAVMAALLTGQAIGEVARQYRISENTVRAWRNATGLGGTQPVAVEKRLELDDLITQYVRETLTTLAVQAQFFRDTTWLKHQPANELAVLHGVTADKAIRILEAYRPDGEEGAEPPGAD